jgi:hypothetical protein
MVMKVYKEDIYNMVDFTLRGALFHFVPFPLFHTY